MKLSWAPLDHRLMWVLIILTQSACAIAGLGSRATPPEERFAYNAAVEQIEVDPSRAGIDLRGFLASYPQSALADDAAEKLAEIAFAEGREDEGVRWLGKILREVPDSDRAAPARFRLAQYEYGRDRWEASRRLLEPLDLGQLTPPEQLAALRLQVKLARTTVERLRAQGALRAALSDELESRRVEPSTRARLAGQLAQVDRSMSDAIRAATTPELETTLAELDRDGRLSQAATTRVLLELARRSMDLGDSEVASARLRRLEDLAQSDEEIAELQELLGRLHLVAAVEQDRSELPPLRDLAGLSRPETRGGRGKIGVVLPLSGNFAEFGERSLQGLLLAADLFAADAANKNGGEDAESNFASLYQDSNAGGLRGDSQIRLIVRDSEGDPAKAAARVRELAADPDIRAIIGPIFTAESLSAAQVAEEVGIPIVVLSHREDVPAGRANVFRTRTTPSDEVNVLVDHAVTELGARRFAVLYPRNRYGRGMRKLYWDAVRARGGKMVAASSYDPGAVDFSKSIRNMIGYRFLRDSERRALINRERKIKSARHLPPEEARRVRRNAYARLGPERMPLPPIVDFDVLFIPDAADKIQLIAPGLAYHEIRGVKLLGSSEWVSDELLRVARHHVRGAVVSTPFYSHSELPFVADFVRSFERTFGNEPDAYAAQAYDAGNLVLVQLAAGRDDRDSIRDGLTSIRAYPGATGVLTMRPDGNARRRPFLLEVKEGRFVPLD